MTPTTQEQVLRALHAARNDEHTKAGLERTLETYSRFLHRYNLMLAVCLFVVFYLLFS
jgi:hypothetical protein